MRVAACPPIGNLLSAAILILASTCTTLSGAPAGQAKDHPASRELLTVNKDFDVKARVRGYGATPSLAERDGQLFLQASFAPGDNSYPAIFLLPPGGKWDLKDCNRIVFQLANTGTEAIRLGCRVSDGPVSDGHKHCNTEMVSLKPGEAKSVTVTFGRSYGNSAGWKIDNSNIKGLSILAEKPKAETTVTIKAIQALIGDMPRPLRTTANETWQPIKHPLVPEKDSALDFSFLLDAPAGKHGPVVIRNGRMEFRDKPGRPARFYGTNLVYGANFPDKATAEIMADQIARSGYNSVRFHHFDQLLLDPKADDSLTFSPEQLDKLDYFFSLLKKRGIYISIDLYATRVTKPHEIPELNTKATMTKFKSAVYILDSARKNWEEFTRRFLTHVNPYTGMAWKDDPALFSLSLINEGQVYQSWGANKPLYQKRFEEINKEAAPSQTADQKAAAWNWFLTDIQRKWTKTGTEFVRSLGTEVLITDANYISMCPLSVFRTDLDVIDIHCYWGGPAPLSGWGAPLSCKHINMVKDGGVHMPLCSIAGRLLGKPFMITEFNVGYPNRYRSVSGPMVGAFSAFQEIDAVYRFDHIGVALNKPGAIIWLSSANDPMTLLGERLGAAMFLREEVRPAESVVPYLVTNDYLNKPKALDWSHWYDDRYIALGKHHKIGTVVLQKNEKLNYPTKALVSWEKVPQERLGDATLLNLTQLNKLWPLLKKSKPSNTPAPQIMIDQQKGTLRILTERSECLFVPEKNSRLEGNFLRAENAEFLATIGAISLDGEPLNTSHRVLLLHLTDVVNDGELYQDKSMVVLRKYGGPGLLARKGAVQLTLRGVGDNAKLYALDLAGKRVAEIPMQKTADGVTFTAQTHREKGTCLAYELVR